MTGKLESRKGRQWLRLLLTPEIGVLVPIIVICIVTTIIKPSFLTWQYLSTILAGSVFIGAASLGEAMCIMTGEIDLSVGFSGCLAGVMCGIAARDWGLPLIACVIVCLGTGAVVGLINGVCVCKLGLSSWIVTLATQFICQGLALTISQGEPISIMNLGTMGFSTARPLGISWLFFIFIGLIIIMDIVFRYTRYGYHLKAVGGNQDASVMAGVNAKRVKIIAFILAGVFAAAGGLFDTLNAQAASASFGSAREFRAIICCAIGGISMSGGAGSAFGIGLGVLLFHTLWYCLRILSVDTNLQLVLIGFILILSVILDIQRKRLETKREGLR